MPYFREIHHLVNEVAQWADQRHEQGVDVLPVVARLKKDLQRARARLEASGPSVAALQIEPNDLPSIRALRPRGPRRYWNELPREGLRSRLRGAWLGRAAGCTLGAPVEDWLPDAMEDLATLGKQPFPPRDYWALHPRTTRAYYVPNDMRAYLKGGIRGVPVDDDTTYTLLGLLILEEFGPAFTTADVGKAWTRLVSIAFTAEEIAIKNLKAGLSADRAGEKGNPYQEWIGADIRSDPWAYAAPGWPEKAAEMAYRDAYLTHRQNGVYGAMLFAAAISAAFAVDDPMEAVKAGLSEVPAKCRLAEDVRWALRTAPKLKDWRDARRRVLDRFPGMDTTHTNNNACLTVFGLHLGQGDFTKTIGYTVAMGMDNDCTAATAGSILGAIIGIENIPEHWWKPFRDKVCSYLVGHETFSTRDVIRRFEKVAAQVWNS
jgi:ADP-ribosylglycohydrolase